MKIGVTGYKGRLGSELVRRGIEPCLADITIPESIREYAESFDVLINCAAYTSVDGAEDNYYEALKINTHGVRNLRGWFKNRIIHISTDYVFDGQSGPYAENMRVRVPINCYGFSKLGGELAMLEPPQRYDTVVRTTGLYGSIGVDLANTAFNQLKIGHEFPAVVDLFANQTYIPHLADALIMLANAKNFDVHILHIASLDLCSRYEFVRKIANLFDFNVDLIEPVKAKDISGWKARRPVNGGLKTWLAKSHGLPIYTIDEGLYEWAKTI